MSSDIEMLATTAAVPATEAPSATVWVLRASDNAKFESVRLVEAANPGKLIELDLMLKTRQEVRGLPMSAMVALFNALAEGTQRPIKKFESREVGTERIWQLMRDPTVISRFTPNTNKDATMSSKTAKKATKATKTAKKATKTATKTAKTPKATSAGAPGHQSGKISNDAIITRISKENPRREGTHGAVNWRLYKDGMTVAQFKAKDGSGMNHLRWDLAHGFIKLTNNK